MEHVSPTAVNGSSRPSSKPQSRKALAHPVLGPKDSIGEGDSRIVYDAVGDDVCSLNKNETLSSSELFTRIKNEVHWQKMYHAHGEVPRLVCAQGEIGEDGSVPVYRHPSDQSLPLLRFSPIVRAICKRVEEIVAHEMNHVLIQLYRSGQDFISEHSDKSLDIARGSDIVNVSLGAQRTMRLRTKKSACEQSETGTTPRKTQLVPLPNGSVFVLGAQTNMRWLHGINADKRPSSERLDSELMFNGERISFTFRKIATYLSSDCRRIWGQGACSKSAAEANKVISGDAEKTQEMIDAFGMENQLSEFDWNTVYGRGFDVLHFTQKDDAVDDPRLLFLSESSEVNSNIVQRLENLGLEYSTTGVPDHEAGADYRPQISLRDNDDRKTEVEGQHEILQYLDQMYNPDRE